MKSIVAILMFMVTLNISGQDLKSALQLVDRQQYEDAEKAFSDLIAKDPSNGDLYYYSGEIVLKDYLLDTFSNSLSEYAQHAEEFFQKGLQQAPNSALNYVGMGALSLLRSSDTAKANSYFRIVEAQIPTKKKLLTPNYAVILDRMGAAQLYGHIFQFDKALKYLNWAKEIDLNNSKVYLTLGDVYLKHNDASSALLNYNKSLSLDPTSPLPKIKIGDIYMRVPNLNAARPYFEEALQIDSTFAPVYRELGELYTLAGRFDLAKANYYKFLQLSGNSTPAKIRYGNSLFRSKDYTDALSVIEEVLKVDQSRNYLYRLAAYSCYEKKPQELEKGLGYIEQFLKNEKTENIIPRDYTYYGRFLYKLAKGDSVQLNKAFEMFNKAYNMDQSDGNLITEMAYDYYYARRYSDAIRMFNLKAAKGIADTKNDPMLIGKSYYQMEAWNKADSAFTKITVDQPGNIQAYLYLARTYSNMDPTSEQGLAAPKFAMMISKIGTDSVKYSAELYEAFSYMGYYNLQKKDYDEAKAWYNRLYNLDSNNKQWQIKALNSLALISYRKKDYVEARDIYLRISKLDPNNPDVAQAISDLNKVITAQKNSQEYK